MVRITLVMLPFAVMYARRHRVQRHGIFTLAPGRIMDKVLFGA